MRRLRVCLAGVSAAGERSVAVVDIAQTAVDGISLAAANRAFRCLEVLGAGGGNGGGPPVHSAGSGKALALICDVKSEDRAGAGAHAVSTARDCDRRTTMPA